MTNILLRKKQEAEFEVGVETREQSKKSIYAGHAPEQATPGLPIHCGPSERSRGTRPEKQTDKASRTQHRKQFSAQQDQPGDYRDNVQEVVRSVQERVGHECPEAKLLEGGDRYTKVMRQKNADAEP